MSELRILVVEDEPVIRERLVEMLYKAGATAVVEKEDVAGARKPSARLSFTSCCWIWDFPMVTVMN